MPDLFGRRDYELASLRIVSLASVVEDELPIVVSLEPTALAEARADLQGFLLALPTEPLHRLVGHLLLACLRAVHLEVKRPSNLLAGDETDLDTVQQLDEALLDRVNEATLLLLGVGQAPHLSWQ